MDVHYWGWRRRRNTREPWEHFGAADAETQARCYVALMDLSELSAHEGEYEYLVLPAGVTPPPARNPQTYRDRMLRPGGTREGGLSQWPGQ
jgi:hypothetical protein